MSDKDKWKLVDENTPHDREILICGGEYYWDSSWSYDEYPFKGVSVVCYGDNFSTRGFNWRGDSTGNHDEYFWYKPKYWQELPEPKVE